MGHSLKALFESRLRKMLITVLVIVTVLGAGVYGYLASLPSTTGPSVTLTSPPIELSMTLDKTQYSFAENMTISFHLRNISNETVILTKTSWRAAAPGEIVTKAEGVTTYPENLLTVLIHFGILMYSSNGTVIAGFVEGSDQANYDIILQPNGSLNQTIFANFAYTVNESGRMECAPGAYGISAVFKASTISAGYTLETPSITFTLG
jgi:hypothetical protein